MPESDPVQQLQKTEDVDVVVQRRKKKVHILSESREWKVICWVDEYTFPHSEIETINVVNSHLNPNSLDAIHSRIDEWFRNNYHSIFNYNL